MKRVASIAFRWAQKQAKVSALLMGNYWRLAAPATVRIVAVLPVTP